MYSWLGIILCLYLVAMSVILSASPPTAYSGDIAQRPNNTF